MWLLWPNFVFFCYWVAWLSTKLLQNWQQTSNNWPFYLYFSEILFSFHAIAYSVDGISVFNLVGSLFIIFLLKKKTKLRKYSWFPINFYLFRLFLFRNDAIRINWNTFFFLNFVVTFSLKYEFNFSVESFHFQHKFLSHLRLFLIWIISFPFSWFLCSFQF